MYPLVFLLWLGICDAKVLFLCMVVCVAGSKHYARALELLLQALTAPALVCSAIVVAAYKKYALTCLIHSGRCRVWVQVLSLQRGRSFSLCGDYRARPALLSCCPHRCRCSGNLVQLPKFTANKVKVVVEAECRAYIELANAYSSHNPDKLRRVREQHQAIFNNVSGWAGGWVGGSVVCLACINLAGGGGPGQMQLL